MIVIVAMIGLVLELIAVKLGTAPFPFAESPIEGVSFVQEKVVVPVLFEVVNGIVGTVSLVQKIKLLG